LVTQRIALESERRDHGARLPTVEDEILRDRTRDYGRRCALGNSVNSFAFLVIRNRGAA
jgi:hypothetical protein